MENKKQSHHKNNFLVCFSALNGSEVRRALVNAYDKKNALRLALDRFCKAFPDIEITRARVSAVYPARVKRIEKRID